MTNKEKEHSFTQKDSYTQNPEKRVFIVDISDVDLDKISETIDELSNKIIQRSKDMDLDNIKFDQNDWKDGINIPIVSRKMCPFIQENLKRRLNNE